MGIRNYTSSFQVFDKRLVFLQSRVVEGLTNESVQFRKKSASVDAFCLE